MSFLWAFQPLSPCVTLPWFNYRFLFENIQYEANFSHCLFQSLHRKKIKHTDSCSGTSEQPVNQTVILIFSGHAFHIKLHHQNAEVACNYKIKSKWRHDPQWKTLGRPSYFKPTAARKGKKQLHGPLWLSGFSKRKLSPQSWLTKREIESLSKCAHPPSTFTGLNFSSQV